MHTYRQTLLLTASTALFSIFLSSTALAASETYEIDPTHTLPRFEYNHMGFSTQQSRFDKASGVIVLDRVAKTGSADISIDVQSINTGVTQLNENIKGEDFLDAARWPSITFKSSSFIFNGDNLTAIEGALTIKGITKPVSLTVQSFKCMPHPRLKKEACGATATTVIRRTDFNAGNFAPMVSDEIRLTIPVEAIKQ
ncbi:YceI family protein [Undibacterium sp. TJN19]|uniref:YceI family protein n=1 Tax=Undibacterium sp. TJN19 TaxID=3413055 RepID=UPI003BF301ED